MDDRKSKLLRDQIEREQRAGRAEAAAKRAAAEAANSSRERAVSREDDVPRSMTHDLINDNASFDDGMEEEDSVLERKNQ